MDQGSLLEGVTVDPQQVDQSVEAHLWAFVDVPSEPTGVSATIKPPASLYSLAFGSHMGSTMTPISSWSEFVATAAIRELRSFALPASGMSTEVSLPLFTFPFFGQSPTPGPVHDHFTTYWDRGWEAEMPQRASPWLKPVLERLQYLRSLLPGWDSTRARSIDKHSIDRVLGFLTMTMTYSTPAPSIVPLESGGLQIEWHRAGLDIEIEFQPGEEARLYFYEISSGEEHEASEPVSAFTMMELGSRLSAGYDPANVG